MFGILSIDTTKLDPWEWVFFFVVLATGLLFTPIGLFLNYWERHGKSRRFQRRILFHLQQKALLKLAREKDRAEEAAAKRIDGSGGDDEQEGGEPSNNNGSKPSRKTSAGVSNSHDQLLSPATRNADTFHLV